jgi:hypothetical protein
MGREHSQQYIKYIFLKPRHCTLPDKNGTSEPMTICCGKYPVYDKNKQVLLDYITAEAVTIL